MASALPECEAQTIMACQLCECNTDVKWKCTECDLLMCQTCSEKIHPKFKFADRHEIISVQDIGSVTVHIKPKCVQCKFHKNQLYCIYCESCEQFACPSCISQHHKKHDLIEIEEVAAKFSEKIQTFEGHITNYILPFYEKGKNNIDAVLAEELKHYEETKSKIIEQETILNVEIKRWKIKMLKELEDAKEEMIKACEKERCCITKETEEAGQKRDKIRNVLAEKRIDHLHDTATSVQVWLSTETPLFNIEKTGFPLLPCFETTTVNDRVIARLYGFFRSRQKASVVCDKSYSIDIPNIMRIKLNRKNAVWVSSGSSNETLKYCVSSEFRLVQEIKDKKSYNIYDMSSTISGDIIFTTLEEDNNVYIVTSEGVKKYRTFSNLLPKAIHLDEDDNIYLSLRDNGPVFDLNNESVRQIVIIDSQKKKEKMRYSHIFDEKVIFHNATRICSDRNRIYIIDALSKKLDGRIIAINRSGFSDWIYDGQIRNDFTPSDLVITNTSYLIVPDVINSLLHIVGSKGILFQVIDTCTENFGFISPCCVDTGSDGKLWIGCGKKKNNQKDTKIIVLSITLPITG